MIIFADRFRVWKDAYRRWFKRNDTTIYIIGFLSLFLFIYLAPRMFIFIQAGERGVLFRRFWGVELHWSYSEGMKVIPPWDSIAIYNMRLQTVDHEFVVLSKDGLPITVEVTMRYRPVLDNLPQLHEEVGPDYFNKIVLPEVAAAIREIFGRYLPEDIYSSDKFVVPNAIQAAMNEVNEHYVLLDDLLIKRIILPDTVREAIEQKLKQKQIALEYDYRLQREQKEAERKRIEAEGIRDFQKTVAQALSENYLRYRGIEATLELAKSPNAKVVIIGGSQGLPLILNTGDGGTNSLNISTNSESRILNTVR